MNKEKRLNNFAGEIKIEKNSLPTASLDEITGIIIGAALCGERLLR